MKKPVFFISSTIYDFVDLRSAIKYHLESQGCEVLASEFNDFKKSLDKHSYQECLDSIKKADYFILLIGSRVGGWFDEKNNISITRQEFREAYTLHLQGKLKIINFVRSDIWDLRSDRNELSKYLENLNLADKEIVSSIKNYPSKHAKNPEFIIDFLNEVSRNEETKGAVEGKNQFPSGNWIHKFSSFRDIVDVINPEIFNGEPIEDALIKKLLLKELRHVLGISLVKFKEKQIYSPLLAIQMFYSEHQLDRDNKHSKFFEINAKRFDSLGTLSYQLLQVRYSPFILPQALRTAAFMRFDSQKGTFTETSLYNALLDLQREIQLFSKRDISEDLRIVTQNAPNRRATNLEVLSLNTFDFVSFMYTLQRWSNIIELSKAIIKCLQGEPFKRPVLFGRSPILGMNEEFAKETVTDKEIDQFIQEN